MIVNNLLFEQTEKILDRVAVVNRHVRLSYRELQSLILEVKSLLTHKNTLPGDNVCLISANSIEFIVTVLALWQIGAIPAPINPQLLFSEIIQLVDFVKPKLIIAEKEIVSKINLCDTISFPDLELKIFPKNKYIERHDYSDIAVNLFTTGSTASPKLVKLTFNNFLASFENIIKLESYSFNDRFLASLPFYHIGGFSIIVRSFLAGASLYIIDDYSVQEIQNAMLSFNPTRISIVPTVLKRLIESNIKPNPGILSLYIGGGPANKEIISEAIKVGWPIIKVYGSTETTAMITLMKGDELINKPLSSGKPMPGVGIKILDKDNKCLPPNEIGTISISGKTIADSYINNDEANKHAFKNQIYFSDDVGYLDEEGYLFVVSRKDNVVVSGGENINLTEVEKALFEISRVNEAVVFSRPDEEWGSIICAAIVLKPGTKITVDEIKSILKMKVTAYKIPKKIYILPEIPKNEMGKISLSILEALLNL